MSIHVECINVRGFGLSFNPDMCSVTESKLSHPRAFSPFLEGYEKFTFPGLQRRCVVVLLKKDSNFQALSLFRPIEQAGRPRWDI